MDAQYQVVDRTPQPVLSVRFRSPAQDLGQHFGRIYGAIGQHLHELGEPPAGPPFAAYYNMDMQDLDVEAGFPVARALPGKADIQPGQLPGGKAGTCVYTGPYDNIGSAYEDLNRWMGENGYEITGVAYEMYLNDPGEVAPQDLMTQIYLPVKE